jgi:hypothetical protein
MDQDSIGDAVRREPFRPFELCMADGRRVLIKHPGFVVMNNRVVLVLDGESYSTTIEPLSIVSLEPVRKSGKSNGAPKKRNK